MEVSLKEISKIVTGNTPSKKNKDYWNSEDICFIKPDVIGSSIDSITTSNEYISNFASSKARIVDRNAILITCIGNIGRIGIVSDKKVAFNQQINAIIPDYKINIRYLAYVLLFSQPRLNALANSAVVPIVNKTQLGNFKVKINPNLESQRRIVSILDKIAKIIKNQTKEIEHLDELIKARFVEMFGDPANPINIWDPEKLGKICILNPKKEKKLENDDLDVSFVPMSAVSENGAINTTRVKKYSEVKKGFTYFLENDVLFAKITPCMENGKDAVAIGLKNKKGFGSTEFHVLRPIKGKSNPYWLYTLTSFQSFRKLAELNMTGSAGQKRVPIKFLQNYKVVVPPISLQNEFANFVQQVDKSKFENIVYLNKTLSSKILSQIGDVIRD